MSSWNGLLLMLLVHAILLWLDASIIICLQLHVLHVKSNPGNVYRGQVFCFVRGRFYFVFCGGREWGGGVWSMLHVKCMVVQGVKYSWQNGFVSPLQLVFRVGQELCESRYGRSWLPSLKQNNNKTYDFCGRRGPRKRKCFRNSMIINTVNHSRQAVVREHALELGQWKRRKLSCDRTHFGVRTMETVEVERS